MNIGSTLSGILSEATQANVEKPPYMRSEADVFPVLAVEWFGCRIAERGDDFGAECAQIRHISLIWANLLTIPNRSRAERPG
jgi:hypothetical protein